MIKNIYSNIDDTDALESFFESINYCSIVSGGIEYRRHATQNI